MQIMGVYKKCPPKNLIGRQASIEGRLSFDPPQRANSVSLGQAVWFHRVVGADGGWSAWDWEKVPVTWRVMGHPIK